MSRHSLVSIDTIISKLYREVQHLPGIDESDLIEMTGEALGFIGAYGQYEEDVCFIEIKNHRGDLPNGLVEIIQVAKSVNNNVNINNCIKHDGPADCEDRCDTDEKVPECWSTHNKYYIPAQRYLDVLAEYDIRHLYTPYFYHNFIPMRLSTNSFKSIVGLHKDDSINLGVDSNFEYSISRNQIVTNFQEGTVAIAYTRQPLDENGWPMIIDNESYKEAITKYIIMKMSYHRFLNNEPGFANIYAKLEDDWHWYCKQAGNSIMMPNSLDEKENLKDINNRMLKIRRGYYGFYGNINTPESRRYDGRRFFR